MGSSMRWLAVAAVATCALLDKTSASDVPPQGPEPTAPARIRALRPLEGVFRRDDGPVTETLDITTAPDTLCGYYTPGTSFSFTCSAGTSCMWENDKYNLAFCGEEDFKTSCIGQADAMDSDKCDDDCRRDPNIQFCTQDLRPYCFTIYFPNGIMKYPCHTARGFSSMNFPDGAENFGTSTLDVTIYAAETTESAESTEESTEEATSTDKSSAKAKGSETDSSGPTVTVVSAPEGDDSDDSDDDNGKHKGKKTNIGAIVGGVLGGLAVIAIVGAIILLVRRRDKQKAQQQAAPQPQPQMQAQSPGQGQMPYPVMAQQHQQQMPYQQGWQQTPPHGWQQSPSPQDYHQTPSPQGFQQSPSPPTFHQSPSQTSSAPVMVEAPDSNTAAVYEMAQPDKGILK
ncbi:hypothetical protein FDECE_4209 [Fusarium decemcellulare]|nr:hypothetical protein FDECE_4209 [Fusarium decemcellulare]